MRIIITFLAFFVFVSFCNAQQFDIGEINDAKYRIYIPENWNKGLVIYCHGYQEIGEEIDPRKPQPLQYVLQRRGGV